MSLRTHPSPVATLILPVYNAESYLEKSLREVHDWLGRRPEAWELVVIDDASTDASRALLAAFAREHPDEAIRIVGFEKNRGKGFAVRAGIAAARGRYSIFTDCDLAYSLDNLPAILRTLDDGADVAIACRVLAQSRYTMSPTFFSYLFTRHVMGRAFNWICRFLTLPKLLDSQAGLKGFRTARMLGLLPRLVLDRFSFDVEMLRALQDGGAKIVEVPVDFRYDTEPSTVAFAADSLRMLRDLIRIRVRSLRGVYRAAAPVGAPAQLVIHADDFGLSDEVNRAIADGLSIGSLTSASILANLPGSQAAIAWAAAHPQFDFGVHVNVTEGRPVLPPERVPSLTGQNGEFRSLPAFLVRLLLGRIRIEELAAEWRAQIVAVAGAGVAVSHIDSHQHVHLVPQLYETAALPLAERAGAALRVMNGPRRTLSWWTDWKGFLLARASALSLARVPFYAGAARGCGTSFMRKPDLGALRRLLDRMEAGKTYELVVHPAYPAEEHDFPGDRDAERKLLASADASSMIRQSHIELVSFRHAGPGDPAARGRQKSRAVPALEIARSGLR